MIHSSRILHGRRLITTSSSMTFPIMLIQRSELTQKMCIRDRTDTDVVRLLRKNNLNSDTLQENVVAKLREKGVKLSLIHI